MESRDAAAFTLMRGETFAQMRSSCMTKLRLYLIILWNSNAERTGMKNIPSATTDNHINEEVKYDRIGKSETEWFESQVCE